MVRRSIFVSYTTPNMDASDHYQTTYDSKTKIVVFYSLNQGRFNLIYSSPCLVPKLEILLIYCPLRKTVWVITRNGMSHLFWISLLKLIDSFDYISTETPKHPNSYNSFDKRNPGLCSESWTVYHNIIWNLSKIIDSLVFFTLRIKVKLDKYGILDH